jgi:hypothetical protein
LTPEQQAIRWHEQRSKKPVEKSKKQLLEALKEMGVTLQQQRGGYAKKELQDFATNNGIALFDLCAPGWEGQPEGVEYSWAHAKAHYRRMPVSRKQGRDNFKQLVKECTCPINVLTKERIETFALQARAYICTYHHLE